MGLLHAAVLVSFVLAPLFVAWAVIELDQAIGPPPEPPT